MTTPGYYALALAAVIAVLLFRLRHRWMNLSCVGAFVVGYLAMNYVGVVFVALGYEYQTRSVPLIADESMLRAVFIANIGFGCCLLGVKLVDILFGPTPVYANRCILNVSANSPLGMNVGRVVILLVLYITAFFWLCSGQLSGIVRLVLGGDVVRLYQFRLETAVQIGVVEGWLTHNLIPYVGLCGLFIFYKHRTLASSLFVGGFFIACIAKLIALHKEPLIVLLLQAGIAWVILRGGPTSAGTSQTRLSSKRIMMVPLVVFLVLTWLMWFTHPDTGGSLWEQAWQAAMMSFERVFGRVSNGYLHIADLVPEVFPHYGFNNSPLWANFFGNETFAINKEVVLLYNANWDLGSIASDAIVNHYGGFGYTGLIVLSVLQGALLAGIDRWISTRPATIGWLVLLIFMMASSFYLTETTLFRAAFGFGGMSFLLHGLLINNGAGSYWVESDARNSNHLHSGQDATTDLVVG